MSLGNPGQRPVVMRRAPTSSAAPDGEPVVGEIERQLHLGQHRGDRLQVLGLDARHFDALRP